MTVMTVTRQVKNLMLQMAPKGDIAKKYSSSLTPQVWLGLPLGPPSAIFLHDGWPFWCATKSFKV